jgi:hypothetical protein
VQMATEIARQLDLSRVIVPHIASFARTVM